MTTIKPQTVPTGTPDFLKPYPFTRYDGEDGSGIYVVTRHQPGDGTMKVNQVILVGQSTKIRDRISSQRSNPFYKRLETYEDLQWWAWVVQPKQRLTVSLRATLTQLLKMKEAEIIKALQPLLNKHTP